MVDDYLKVKFVSVESGDKVPSTADVIELLVENKDFSDFQLNSSIVSSIEQSFTKKETKVILSYTTKRNFLVSIPDRDKESIRLAGASLYNALKKEQSDVATINGLASLSSIERYAFLEGLILSSYDFNKYRRKKAITNASFIFLLQL